MLFSSGFDQAVILKMVLYCFELASGLKIIFSKSRLIKVGVDPSKDSTLSSLLNCELGSLPFKYLGLPLSDRGPKKEDWMMLIDKVDRKLAG